MSGCALSISDKDAILIKYFQYFAYEIIREGEACECMCVLELSIGKNLEI